MRKCSVRLYYVNGKPWLHKWLHDVVNAEFVWDIGE